MKIRKLILAICPVILMVGFLSGCNTVAGAGQDISDTGQTITHAAKSAEPN